MGADLGRRAPNPYGHSAGEGAAALELARQRSEMAAGEVSLISMADAAKIARVSGGSILRAYRMGDLPGVRGSRGADEISFKAEDVRAWARAKKLTFD